MPFTPSTSYQPLLERFVPDVIEEDDDFSFADKVQAAFTTENTLGAALTRESDMPAGLLVDNDYNPWDELTEAERLDEQFLDQAVMAESPQRLQALRDQSAKEKAARAKLQGVDGALLSMAAGVLDPVNLIPVGGVTYKTYRTGGSILRNGLVTASVAASSAAAQEAILHSQQIERTFGESALNVTAASLLGMALGSASAAFSKADYSRMVRETEEMMDMGPARPGSVGAASAVEDIDIQGKVAARLAKATAFDPLTRTLVGRSQQAKRALVELAENPINVDGYTGQAVESLAKVRRDSLLFRGMREHIDIYKDYRKQGGKLRRKQFNELVAREQRNPGSVDDPHVQRSAAAWQRNVYEPQFRDIVDAKLLPEDIEVTTANQYLNRAWNKEKLAAKLPQFIDTVSEWLKTTTEKKAAVQGTAAREFDAYKNYADLVIKRNRALQQETSTLASIEKRLSRLRTQQEQTINRSAMLKQKAGEGPAPRIAGGRNELSIQLTKTRNEINTLYDRASAAKYRIQQITDDLAKYEAKADEYLTSLEKTLAEWPGKTGNRMRRALKSRDADETAKANKYLMRDVAAITKVDLDTIEYDDLASQIAGRIMSTPDGMLPYDYKIGTSTSGPNPTAQSLKSPFKARVFDIPDDMVEEFLDNDIEALAGRYLRQTSTDIELVRRFGDDGLSVEEVLNLTQQKKDIADEFRDLMRQAKTEKERVALRKEMNRALDDIQGIVERMRGTYDIPDPENIFHRFMHAARNLNFLRFMGGVTISSFPDAARVVMSEGFGRAFGTAMRPLVRGIKNAKLAAADVKYWGIGTDAITGGRMEVISDINDYALGGTKLERGLQSMANTFGNINLMNQWTSLMKVTHAISMQSRVMDDLAKGKFDTRLEALGINRADAFRIAEQVQKHGAKDGNAWIYNAKNWDDQTLAMQWAAALKKESDRVIIVPGQERPLFMSREAGKTLMQFKSFMMSATQRVLIAGLQGQDAHAIQGVVAMITLGALTYALKQVEAGRPVSDDPRVWIMEGIDRSGAVGILMEINNTVEKISSNNLGVRPLIGVAQGASRYATRNATESLLGPTWGSMLSTTLRVANASTSEFEWTEGDTSAVRRLLPYQNLFIVRSALNQVENLANEALQ